MALPITNNGSGLVGGYLANRLQGLQSPLGGGQSIGPTPGQTAPTMADRMASAPTADHTMYGQYGGYFDDNGHYTTSRNNGTGSAASLALQAGQAAAGYTNPNDPRLQAGRPLSNYMQQNGIQAGTYQGAPTSLSDQQIQDQWNQWDQTMRQSYGIPQSNTMANVNSMVGYDPTKPTNANNAPGGNDKYGTGYTGFGGSSLTASGNPVYNGGAASGGSGGGGSSGPTNGGGNVPGYYAGMGGGLGIGMPYPIAPVGGVNSRTGIPNAPVLSTLNTTLPAPTTTTTGGLPALKPIAKPR